MNKRILGVCMAVSLVVPLAAFAQTNKSSQIAAIMAQLQILQARLQELQSQEQNNQPEQFCFTFSRNLKIYDSGDDVAALSRVLSGGMEEKGVFGETLASIVTGFQETYFDEILRPAGLTRGNGFVGRLTRAKLNQLYGCNAGGGGGGGIMQPTLNISGIPYNYLMLGHGYESFRANVSSNMPSARVVAYLQRPDGTFKYDANNDVLANQLSRVYTNYTNTNGYWSAESGMRILGNVGQVGTWKAWVTVGGVRSNTVSFNVVGPTTSQPLTVSSSDIVGEQATYNPGQTINFSVRGLVSDGTIGKPEKGFNVQAWMQTLDPINTVQINGVYQSFNATYNPATSLWDITMTAPSDASKTYKIDTAFYCSNSSLGCSDGQINKSFNFNLSSRVQPSITVTYPNGGEKFVVGEKDVDFRPTWISSNLSGNVYVYLNFVDGGMCLLGSTPVSQGNFPAVLGLNYQCSNIPKTVTPGQYKIVLATDTSSPTGDMKGVSDSSDGYFSIVSSYSSIPNISSVSPNSLRAGDMMTVYGSNLYGNVFLLDGNYGTPMSYQDPAGTSVRFVIPWNTSVGAHSLRVEQKVTGTPGNTVLFNVISSTNQPSITITSPVSGSVWQKGNALKISWTSTGVNEVYIKLRKNSLGDTIRPVADNGLYGSGTHYWTIPNDLPDGNDYVIRILDKNSQTIADSAPFSITSLPSTVVPRITSPQNGQTLRIGDTYTFQVQPVVGATQYLWGFRQYPNGQEIMVHENYRDFRRLDGTTYTISPSNQYYSAFKEGRLQVVVRGSINGQWTDTGSVDVTLAGASASVTVISPNGGEKWQTGSTQGISFNWSGNPTKLRAQLQSASGVKFVKELFPDGIDTGTNGMQYKVGVTSDIPEGSYTIQICDSFYAVGSFVCDSSDAPFTIEMPLFATLIGATDQDAHKAFVNLAIKGVPENKYVSSWKLITTCPQGVTVVASKSTTNMCGSQQTYSASSYFDVTKDISMFTAVAENKTGSTQTVSFTLEATGINGKVARSEPYNISLAPLVINSEIVGVNNITVNQGTVTLSIKGFPTNTYVSSWKLTITCPSGVLVTRDTMSICGDKTFTPSAGTDVTRDMLFFDANSSLMKTASIGLTNITGAAQNVTFKLTAYGPNGIVKESQPYQVALSAPFTSAIKVTYPNTAGTVITPGSSQSVAVTWTTYNINSYKGFSVALMDAATGAKLTTLSYGDPYNLNRYMWYVPSNFQYQGGQYRIMVTSVEDPSVSDQSDEPFRIGASQTVSSQTTSSYTASTLDAIRQSLQSIQQIINQMR
jgi:hypothetical protein